MKESTKDKMEGAGHEVKGAVKQKVGQVTGNTNIEVEGAAEKIGGKIQKKVGDAEERVEKAGR